MAPPPVLPPLPSAGAEPSDADLVAASRGGDADAWEKLVRRYARLVASVPRRQGLSADVAGEVFDAVYAELWRALPHLEKPQQVRAWLVTVARRHSLAQAQYQRRWVNLAELEGGELSLELRDPSPAGDTLLLDAEREQEMRLALSRLSPRCRQLLEWLFYADPAPDYAEIGKRLGLAGNSIGFLRGRCLRKLRQALEDAQAETGKGMALEETK